MPDPTTVRLPHVEELARRWAEIEPLLRKATVRTGCYEPIDLLRMAMAGQAGIWLAERDDALDAVIVTEVRQYPRRRILEVPFIAGRNMRRWHELLLRTLEQHGRELGCECLVGMDRKGWARVGGFRIAGYILVRDL